MDAVVATGSVPAMAELVERLGIGEDAIRSGLATLAAADYLALDVAGRVTCLYPFSTAPTPHGVIIGGRRRSAMCAIDALGVPAMLDTEFAVEGRCAVCEAPIALRVRPGAVITSTPESAMVVARRDEGEPAFAGCCPFTVFVCGSEHADRLARRISGTRLLPLPEALSHAEEIFGGLLAEDLPATRPRGRQWGRSRDD